MAKLIIESRINEYEMRDRNPHVPWSADEIAQDAARCREAGAAIVHFHARMPDGGPEVAPDAVGRVIARIREESDILVHSTLGSLIRELPVRERLQPVLDLARDPTTRPDILPLCLSSPNWDFFHAARGGFVGAERVYVNPTSELIESMRVLAGTGVGLACVAWEVGATRRILALREAGILADPVYLPFHLTSGGMLAGHPGTEEGLDAHLAFLPKDPGIVWAVMNLHGSMLPLAEKIIREGGHIQIGIGDYHYEEIGAVTNAELVQRIAEMARRLGREIATPDEARTILALGEPTAG